MFRRAGARCKSGSKKQSKKQTKTSNMKTIFRFTLLALIATAFCACDDDKSYVAPLDVTPNNLAGTWQLAQWNGAPLAEGSYVYIEFIRKDQKYVMYQNLDSFILPSSRDASPSKPTRSWAPSSTETTITA